MDVDTPGPSENKPRSSPNKTPEGNAKKPKTRAKKRRRDSSGSSDMEEVLPDNTLEMEKKLHALAIKNNLDDVSVKKILKKVVTNDHVLALVKMREEEADSSSEDTGLAPKLTRAKAKELMKESPKLAPWNLALSPINHIPVKTTPEVSALIAQDMPDDEDDDEYHPTLDDVHSDDEHTDVSCSDIDSQPRTPAPSTPLSQPANSPAVLTDGPFKVPQELRTPTRRRLDTDEEPTIARRTRSKLSLSATPIEQLESSFIPPDEVPLPDVDSVWSEFLSECLNPATSVREGEDEDDPEYNVAADPDAIDEDEEALESSIIKISKKELNDLVTELFHIMPEEMTDRDLTSTDFGNTENFNNTDRIGNLNRSDGNFNQRDENLNQSSGNLNQSSGNLSQAYGNINKSTGNVNQNTGNVIQSSSVQIQPVVSINVTKTTVRWEGKQEPVSDNETENLEVSQRVEVPRPIVVTSIGKTEPMESENTGEEMQVETAVEAPRLIEAEVRGTETPIDRPQVPLVLRGALERTQERVEVVIPSGESVKFLPQQVQLLQQQLRQHVQLSTSNFLQLYIHPMHWSSAPAYKEYLETLEKISKENANSIASVCNLAPALELVRTWEASLSADTPENRDMVRFMQAEIDESRRRAASHSIHTGDFHPTFKKVIATSPVFLYPYLLPPMPYRTDNVRKNGYLRSEDELIATSLDQFWQHVEDNTAIYRRRKPHARTRWGFSTALEVMCKVNFPWFPYRCMHGHISHLKKQADPDNPIIKFFRNREITPVKHTLLPFNPHMNLYQQPEKELPLAWLKYVSETSSRAKQYLADRQKIIPEGVSVELDKSITVPTKKPLHPDFTKKITSKRKSHLKKEIQAPEPIAVPPIPTTTQNFYTLVETTDGAFLVPLVTEPQKVAIPNINITKTVLANNLPDPEPPSSQNNGHCQCCVLLRKMCKRQTSIEEYFKPKTKVKCPCMSVENEKISNKLRVLVKNYRSNYNSVWSELNSKISGLKGFPHWDTHSSDLDDILAATTYQLKLSSRMALLTVRYDIRKRFLTQFSRFDPDGDNPLHLAKELKKVFDTDMVDLYKEFAAFLTAEQADKLGLFKEYFVQNCLGKIVERVEKDLQNTEAKLKFLETLNRDLAIMTSPCKLCTTLLKLAKECGMTGFAKELFDMFPHRVKDVVTQVLPAPQPIQPQNNPAKPQETTKTTETTSAVGEAPPATADYEADHSSNSGDDNTDDSDSEPLAEKFLRKRSKNLEQQAKNKPPTPTPQQQEETNFKMEPEDSDSETMSLLILSESEEIKTEVTWKKNEDKIILEFLKESLSSEEMRGISVLEILEKTSIFDKLSECFTDKSRCDIEERVSYLLDMVVSATDE